jgi:DNA-binding response OmpR family regulator
MSRPIRILWIEDDLQFAELGCLNMQTAAARNGDTIILEVARTLDGGIIRSEHFDCVLLDLDLPDSRKDDTLLSLPSMAEKLPPIIVLSAFTFPDENETGLYWRVLLSGAENVFFKSEIIENPHRVLDAIKKAVLIRHRFKHAA